MRLRYSVALAAGMILALGRSTQAQSPHSPTLSNSGTAASTNQNLDDSMDLRGAAPKQSRPSALETPGARQRLNAQERQIESLTNQVELLSQRRDRAQFQTALSADSATSAGSVVTPLSSPLLAAPAAGELQQSEVALRNLRQQQQAAPLSASPEELQKQLELQRKQIEVLEKMVQLLAGQIEKQGPALTDVQTQVATLSARSQQGAQRDQELAAGIDNLTDQLDAQLRYGPELPSQLKELFLPSGTNETPLSIYNALSTRYQYFPNQPGVGKFQFIEYDAIVLLHLNDRFLFESQLEVHPDGLEPEFAQVDWIVNDSLTAVGGRFLAPLGAFNERLHFMWINKLPDFPIFAWQVIPGFDLNLNGAQLRGARYLWGSPWKVEYAFYMSNGWGVPGQGALNDFADVTGITDQSKSVNNATSYGGRIGFWRPASGFFGGISYFGNSPYSAADGIYMNIWDLDLNYHQGNWDARFEGAQTFQKTGGFIGNDIVRRGLYTQIAYRRYESPTDWISKTELVFRYSYADIHGIPLDQLDLTAFTFLNQAPVSRNQYTMGVNYYPYPSMAFRLAYEFNKEFSTNLKDDVLLSGFAWGF